MQDSVLTELTETDHTSVDRIYYQMVCQVSFSYIFFLIFLFKKFLEAFYLFFFISKFYFLGCKFFFGIQDF